MVVQQDTHILAKLNKGEFHTRVNFETPAFSFHGQTFKMSANTEYVTRKVFYNCARESKAFSLLDFHIFFPLLIFSS